MSRQNNGTLFVSCDVTGCAPGVGEGGRTPCCTQDTRISLTGGHASHLGVGHTAISSRRSRDTPHRKNISPHETSGAFPVDSPR